jgi:epoxyqueuosine reductase
LGAVSADRLSLTDEVISTGLRAGLDAVGVAAVEPFLSTRVDLISRKADGLHGGMAFTYRNPERSTEPGRILPGAASLVVGAKSYLRAPPPQAGDRPTGRVARYAWDDTYEPLRAGLAAMAERLRSAGYAARVVADDNALVDREAAARAGLGWYGKNANLLLPGRGSWFVLGSVVTDAALSAAPSRPADGCGSCRCCLAGCPTEAIVAPGVVDARRCLAWLLQAPGVFPRQWREALGDRMYGCDDCQEVCPPNRTADRSAPSPVENRGRPWVDILAWLALDDDALLAAAGRWYVPNRAPRYLRRNALLVLGNTGSRSDPDVVAAVATALDDDDPVVRAHAVWAAARIGRPELAKELRRTEADPMVWAELELIDDVRPNRRSAPS